MTRGDRISHTPVMATGLAVGGDVEQALGSVGVPSYVLDTTGIVRWINPAAERLLGDVRGRHFTSVVAPEDSRRAGELFSRKVLGASPATDSTGVLVTTGGTRVAVEISSVPLMNGERVVGVFGLFEGQPRRQARAVTPASHPPSSRGASPPGAGPLDEADRRRAPREHRDGQEPHPPSLSRPPRPFPARSRRRRAVARRGGGCTRERDVRSRRLTGPRRVGDRGFEPRTSALSGRVESLEAAG